MSGAEILLGFLSLPAHTGEVRVGGGMGQIIEEDQKVQSLLLEK